MGIVRYREVLYAGKHEPLVTPETWQKVQERLAANNFAGEKQREHNHYLKGSVYCGACGSRLVVSHAKNRHGTIYPYFICIGRQQRRTTCTQQAIRIDQTEDAVAAVYAAIRLTADQVDQVRDFILDEMNKLRAGTDHERTRQQRRLAKLHDERKKVLDAHYADAIPLDLLKTEQARITAEIAATETRLAAADNDFAAAEANLIKALALIEDCEGAYLNAPDNLRRQFNQAFFKRLLIDDNYNITGELAEPFETLLSEDIRQAAALRAGAELIVAVDEVFRTAAEDPSDEPELAHAGARPRQGPAPTVRIAQGLKEKTMVGAEGLEPPTPSL
ncbi:MAG: hypothetical protein F2812_11175 [Actinobacteria bacterium]|nr:hypothetical protein [Actinomycetota bacterium]